MGDIYKMCENRVEFAVCIFDIGGMDAPGQNGEFQNLCRSRRNVLVSCIHNYNPIDPTKSKK